MLKTRPYLAYFSSTLYMTDIVNGDICVAMGYSGRVYPFGNCARAAGNGVVVDWRLPREGASLWFDTWAIPASATNVDQAHAFINYLREPEVIAAHSDYLGYPNANRSGRPLVSAGIRDNHNLAPSAEMLNNCYVVQPLPQPIERTRAWSRIKAGG